MKKIFVVMALLLSQWSLAQNVAEIFSFNPKTIFIKHKILDHGQSVRVYVRAFCQEKNVNDFSKRFQASYRVKEDFASLTFLIGATPVSWSATSLTHPKEGEFQFYFEIIKPSLPLGEICLDLIDNQSGQIHKFVLPAYFAKTKLREEYAIFTDNSEYPVMENYVHQGEQFMVRNLSRTITRLHVMRFKEDYPPALTPMNLSQLSSNKKLEIDSSFTITTNEFIKLPDKGLYLIRKDTTAFYGIGLRVEPENYLKFADKEQLVNPLTYISTPNELKKIQTAEGEEIKKSLDRYWLEMTEGNTERARHIIRFYFQRVKQANQLFAAFKEGWKTDMGLVWIVFGKPNEIIYEKDAQRWVYLGKERNFSKVNFTFQKKPNQFTDDYYLLVRYVEYETVWYPMIESIRKGLENL